MQIVLKCPICGNFPISCVLYYAVAPHCYRSEKCQIPHRRLCSRLQKRSSKLSRLKTLRSRQKSYADKRRKPLEFKVRDRVLLKVSPWKGVVRFGKKGKLAPRYVGPFKIVECVGQCLAESDTQIPLKEIKVDENLCFVEEPIEIVERDVKKLKHQRIPLVKVQWNSRQGAEYTWEREDQFKTKYPHLFASTSPAVAS
nr:putative reverse transcriptase domain-containing protein [Tanacetum cinerariifolium]